MRTAFLFLAHECSFGTVRTFRRIRAAAASHGDVHWLYDAGGQRLPRVVRRDNHFSFTPDSFDTLSYPMLADTLVPGSCHFPLLEFFHHRSEYDYYWVIEYDVRFNGSWKELLDDLQSDPADLVASHIRDWEHEPDWAWWDVNHPTSSIPLDQRLRSFNPVYRLSSEALEFIHAAHIDGWTGHNEVLIPTLLYNNGFELSDIGGAGPYTPEDRMNKYYVEVGTDFIRNGSGAPAPCSDKFYAEARRLDLQSGTYRHRPFFFRSGPLENKLYHPVKPIRWIASKYRSRLLHRFRRLRDSILNGSNDP